MFKKALVSVFFLLLILLAGCQSIKGADWQANEFSFSLVWNVYGISSYDSATGKLVKTTDATDPSRYETTLILSDEQLEEIRTLLQELDPDSYPESYNPAKGISIPFETLVLTVRVGGKEKTVRCETLSLLPTPVDKKAEKFLNACRRIEEIITSTEEWRSLPEYEFFYD